MLRLVFIISIFLFITLSLASPIDIQERDGQDLLEPRHGHPTKCVPIWCKDGYLAVFAKNGSSIGYVSKKLKANFSPNPTWAENTYTVGPKKDALIVSLPSRHSSILSHPFNIATHINEPDLNHPWFGAAQFDDPLGVGKAGFALLSATDADTAPKVANLATTNGKPGESFIWTLNCESHHLTPHWINNDGISFKAELFYILKGNGDSNGGDGLGIYGDPLVVSNTHYLANIPVNIKFIARK